MAVSKLWAVNSRLGQVIDYAANPEKTAADIYTEEQYQALADVLSYAKDEEKTEREYFVEGINCNPTTARDQFVSVKQAYGKEDGIQAYHGYLSFKEQNITPELAQKIGMEFANEVWGERFQVVVTTHLNTKHLHCHYVINSVSFKDGKRCQDTSWFIKRHPLSRSYGVILPSSLTRVLPFVSGFSPRPPASVSGTGTFGFTSSFSRQREITCFATLFRSTSHLSLQGCVLHYIPTSMLVQS